MQLKAPHWLIIALGIVGSFCAYVAGQPGTGAYAPIFGGLAALCTLVTGAAGIVSHSALTRTVVTPDGSEVHVPLKAAERGFARAGVLSCLAATSLALALLACAAFKSVEPAAQTLEECAANFAEAHVGLDFADFAIQGALACGGDVEAFVQAIIDSKDLSVAQYSAAARATKGDPAAMAALKSRFGSAKALRDAGVAR